MSLSCHFGFCIIELKIEKGEFNMEILKVENLNKVYGEGGTKVIALNDVSFSVNKGEFVAIVGASGSGKSTLLHLIGGVDRPTSGKVYIDGKDIYKFSDDELAIFRRRQVGLIYQFYNLIPILNVEENILLPLDLDNRDVNKKTLEDLITLLGLKERRHHLPSELSRRPTTKNINRKSNDNKPKHNLSRRTNRKSRYKIK